MTNGAGAVVSHQERLARWVPAVRWLRAYQPGWLRHDAAAGIVLTALLVPVGMGYAQASGLPAITGLYTTLVGLLVYALLGPSRILVLGPDSALAPLIAAAILPLAAGDQAQAVALAGTLALLAGAICFAMGLAGFGFLAALLSKPVRVGYLDGIAITVIVSQLPALFGFSVDADGLLAEAAAFVEGVRDGLTEPAALAIGAGSLAIILLGRRLLPWLPGVLVAVVAATVAVALLGLGDEIPVVGTLPSGLPPIGLPPLDPSTLAALLPAALGIALISFTDTSVLSRSLVRRGDPPVNQDQELVALGAADLAAGLSGGFPTSSSASRTPVAAAAGSRTQLTGVVAAGLLVVVLVALPWLFTTLPSAALAAVVIAAGLGLIDVEFSQRLWRTRRSELALLLASFLGVALLGVIPGIGLAVGLSLLDFVRRAWWPHDAVLGRVPGVKGYHDAGRHDDVRFVPGLLIYRWDAPLFFANADIFHDRVLAALGRADGPVHTLVIAAEPITDIDVTAAEVVERLAAELAEDGITLCFAEMKGPVKDRLRRYDLYDRIGDANFQPTVGTAVKAHVARTGVAWQDWEDQPPS